MRRRILGLCVVVGLTVSMVGPLAPPAQAVTNCKHFGMLYSLEGEQGAETYACVTYSSDRGYRGYVKWYTLAPHAYQVVGNYHVELKRNGVHLANSDEWKNPIIPACLVTSCSSPLFMNTDWVKKASGNFCVYLWEWRFGTNYVNIESGCMNM